MQGPIHPMVRHQVDVRNEAMLPTAWISSVPPPNTWVDGTWLTRGSQPAVRSGDEPVLVLLGEGSADARAELLEHASSGARVYALVGPIWGKDRSESQILQLPRVLIRRVPEVPVTSVSIGKDTRLWLGGGVVLRLDDHQAENIRLTFLRLFWHEAIEETWSGDSQFFWRVARERPFDIPEVPPSASVRWERPDAQLTFDAQDALIHITSGLPPKGTPRRLWFPASPDNHDRLAQFAQAGVEIVWEDRGLPDLFIAGRGGEALLSGTLGRLRLRFNADQATEIARLLEKEPAWQFHTNVRLGDAIHRTAAFWIPGESDAHELETEQFINVPEVQATSLQAMPDTMPASLSPARPLALSVRYQWTVIPPRVPSGAEEDAIVRNWRQLDKDWTHRVARVREALVSAEDKQGRIGRAFSRLVSALLGFEHTRGGLLVQVDELVKKLPSRSGLTGAPILLNELEKIEDATRKLNTDIEEAERKAREDEEREKQQAAWQARVDAANRDLPEQRMELENAESLRNSIAIEQITNKNNLKTAKKEFKKDLIARRQKLSDDLGRAVSEINRISGKISMLAQQADEVFEFKPPATTGFHRPQPGGRFVPPSSSARSSSTVPDDALPEVGSLRTKNGQRYLVIQTWEDLAAGELAASRLSAKLVAPEDT